MQTCIILAGGLGTRLRSVVADLPKCLAPVGSRPFLDIQIRQLASAGVTDVVLSLGHLAHLVIEAVPSRVASAQVRHVVEPELLGTGGAIQYALDQLGLDEVIVANGDTYLEGDLVRMLDPLDRASGELLRMAIVEVPDRARFGGVAVADDSRVIGFLEKGQQGRGFINAGMYRLCRDALLSGHVGAYSLETAVLPDLVTQSHVRACAISGEFIDIGIPDDYRRFCEQHG